MKPLDPNKTLAELLASDKGQDAEPEPQLESQPEPQPELTEQQKNFVEFPR